MVLWSDGFRGTHPNTDGRTLLERVRPGSIVLAHDGGPQPTQLQFDLLPLVLRKLSDRGLRFLTVSDLMATVPGSRPAGPTLVPLIG